jgi:uncharacterized membrane protein YdbT with pleckstrin-like domain
MGRLDGYLDGAEHVFFRTRLHPVVFGGTVFFSAFVIGATALIVERNALEPHTVALLWLGALVVIVGSWVSPLVRWRAAEFAATNRRLLVTRGGLRVRLLDVRGAAAQAVEVQQTVAGRWFGYGTLRFVADDGALHVFPRVARAGQLRDAVRRYAGSAARQRAR